MFAAKQLCCGIALQPWIRLGGRQEQASLELVENKNSGMTLGNALDNAELFKNIVNVAKVAHVYTV